MQTTRHHDLARGFSLVELLMTMFILAIGLLGLATLQVMAQTQGLDSRQRGTASFAAHNLLDQIQAEGALTAGERAISTDGTVSLNGRNFVYVNPLVGADATTPNPGPSYTVLGLLADDPYYAAHPTAGKDIVYTTTWIRGTKTINTYAKSGVQEFIVNVSWTEVSAATKAPVQKYISVSRYVRI
jgi:prepilin-type N-terminal cleavage/methylation domain-containing protein